MDISHSFFLSWVLGAYYYVIYYGNAVKPHITSGAYSWAHSFFMETKEHVFIIMPFLAVVFALGIHALKKSEDPALKRALIWIGGLILVLGAFIIASGVIISGAVR